MSESTTKDSKPESKEQVTPPGSPEKKDSRQRDRSHSRHRHHHRDRSRSHHHHHHHRHHSRSRTPEKDRRSSKRDSSTQSSQQQQQQAPPRKRASGWDSGTVSSSLQQQLASINEESRGNPQINMLTMPSYQGIGEFEDPQARKLYIGNVPPELSEQMLIEWVNALMIRGKLTVTPGNPVTGATMHPEKTYAFLAFRCPEEASAALSLDGLKYNGSILRFRRPTDYKPPVNSAAATNERGPQLSTAMRKELGFSAVPSVVPESPDKMYIGGLPSSLTEDQIIELLTKCGELSAFDLIRDYQTGVSKGYAFFLYKDPAESNPKAIESFNGIQIGGKTLFVQLASYGAKPRSGNSDDPLQASQPTAAAFVADVQAQQQQILQQQQQPLGPRDLDNPTPQMLLELNNPADSMISMMVKAFSDKARGVYKEGVEKRIITDTNDLPDSDPTPVLQIANMASLIEINNGAFFENLLEDIRSFFSEFGTIISIHIPRTMERLLPGQFRFEAPLIGQGRVFIEFEDATAAKNAQKAIKFRCYNGRALITKFIPLSDYHRIITTNESILKEAHAKYVEELKKSYDEAEAAIFTIDSLEDSLRLANSKQLAITNGPSHQAQQPPQLLLLTQAPAVPLPTLPPESKDAADENDDLFR